MLPRAEQCRFRLIATGSYQPAADTREARSKGFTVFIEIQSFC